MLKKAYSYGGSWYSLLSGSCYVPAKQRMIMWSFYGIILASYTVVAEFSKTVSLRKDSKEYVAVTLLRTRPNTYTQPPAKLLLGKAVMKFVWL